MTILIGLDEAGYGPNLGPLVISATAFRVADDGDVHDLYALLPGTFTRDPRAKSGALLVADSKVVYQSQGTMDRLEQAILGLHEWMSGAPRSWSEWMGRVVWSDDPAWALLPWHCGRNVSLPCAASWSHIAEVAARLGPQLAERGVELLAMRSTAIFPSEFNRFVRSGAGKGDLLSLRTVRLFRQLLGDLPPEKTYAVFDRQGGRQRYWPILQSAFPDHWIDIRSEVPRASTYRLMWGDHPCDIEFLVKGEAFLPTALASMQSKYVRELAMKLFNQFWRDEVPDLRPTAGYAIDARRFRAQIATRQAKLGIADDLLWRCR